MPIANGGANVNVDSDSDGLIDLLDCGDNDAGSLYPPMEVTGVTVSIAPTMISWDSQTALTGLSTVYDVATGSLGALFTSGTYAAAGCLASDLITTSTPDPVTPAVGQGVYYLPRVTSGCADGTYGNSTIAPDPRDFLDDPVTTPCP